MSFVRTHVYIFVSTESVAPLPEPDPISHVIARASELRVV